MGNDGIVIADTEPSEQVGKFTWLQIMPDGSRKWYEKVDGGWSLTKTEDAPALASHTHEGLDQLPDIISLLNNGVTGTRTVGKFTITVNHGVITGFEEA